MASLMPRLAPVTMATLPESWTFGGRNGVLMAGMLARLVGSVAKKPNGVTLAGAHRARAAPSQAGSSRIGRIESSRTVLTVT